MGGYVAMGGREDFDDRNRCLAVSNIVPMILGSLAALALVSLLFYFPLRWSEDTGKFPEYTVAVTGFDGIDPDREVLARATLDPSFELTIRIRETRRWSTECVEQGTTGFVSYQGVPLARGTAPEFCGVENTTVARSMMAWGNAVPVPRFARERLAEELRRGEAAVDVTLKEPETGCRGCGYPVVECKAVLGHGKASPSCKVGIGYGPAFPPYDPSGMIQPEETAMQPVCKPCGLQPLTICRVGPSVAAPLASERLGSITRLPHGSADCEGLQAARFADQLHGIFFRYSHRGSFQGRPSDRRRGKTAVTRTYVNYPCQ